jgi:hypothetical protein
MVLKTQYFPSCLNRFCWKQQQYLNVLIKEQHREDKANFYCEIFGCFAKVLYSLTSHQKIPAQ